MAVAKEYLQNLSSESDSENELEKIMLLHDICRGKRSVWRSEYMEKRTTHGEFALTCELSDARYKNCFRLSRDEFADVHNMIQSDISSKGCNAQKPIGSREKLAMFFRWEFIGIII